jgi:LCP family protein required for cell wall assembly
VPEPTAYGVDQRAGYPPVATYGAAERAAVRMHPRRRAVDDHIDDADTVVIPPSRRRAKSLGGALLTTLAAAVLPGLGHLILRRRTGWVILASFLLAVAGAVAFVTRYPRSRLLEYLLNPDTLTAVILGCFLLAVLWLATVLRTYDLARPHRLSIGKQLLGGAFTCILCLTITAPFALAGYTVNAQRNLLNALFPSGSDGSKTPVGDANAIKKPRINILLLGSDAGEGRIGTRTDTMVVASIDTKTARTILFSLPRNTSFAQFPLTSAMAKQFPKGFHNPSEPASGNYFLNAVYAFGTENPALAPPTPSHDPGLNLLMSSISYMLGLDLDYYIKVDMAGFASIVDALGGLDVNVGTAPVPMGGIGPFGEVVKPFGWIPAGRQHLNGQQALWFARSRTNSTDYVRMGRQRCLLQYMIDQKTPMDVLKNFQAVSSATKDSVVTNIPQEVLPALVTLAGKAKSHPLGSIAFDPSLPDLEQPDGRFNTGDPNFPLMKRVVRDTINPPAATSAAPTTTVAPTKPPAASRKATTPKTSTPAHSTPPPQPVSLEEACSGTPTG